MTATLFQWRPLAPGELDHERLWLCVSAATGVLALAGYRAGLRPPPCLFHLVTGYPCPGCGSTRAILQLARGNVAGAFAFNPLITTIVLGIIAYCLYAALVLALRTPRLRLPAMPRRGANTLRVLLAAAVAANWWWVLAHGL